MINSLGSPAIVGGSFTYKEYPSPSPTFNIANVILNLGATTSTYIPTMGLIPGVQIVQVKCHKCFNLYSKIKRIIR